MTLVLGRRALLAAVAALPLAGCTGEPSAPPVPDPDDVLREEAAERERALLRKYDAVLLALPELAPRLAAVRAQHVDHLEALVDVAPSASPRAAPEVGPPASPAAALAALAEAEQQAGLVHGQAALAASAGDLAGLLGSLSASELTHPVVLG